MCKREPSNVLAERNLNHGDEVQHHHSFLCVQQNACSNEKGLYGIETTCRMVNEKVDKCSVKETIRPCAF